MRADVLFIRTQSTIRADGLPSAQDGPPQFELPECIRMSSTSKPCALRAPTVFSARMKSASAQKTKFQWRLMREARYAGTKTRFWIKAKAVWGGFYTRSAIAHGCAFHPRAIDDPRGRLLVRAKNRNSAATAGAF
ncbi:MAG: hypothetical protein V1796_05965 [Pseudomonadota bacterium]